jgi:hypothetical protein
MCSVSIKRRDIQDIYGSNAEHIRYKAGGIMNCDLGIKGRKHAFNRAQIGLNP